MRLLLFRFCYSLTVLVFCGYSLISFSLIFVVKNNDVNEVSAQILWCTDVEGHANLED